MTMRRDVLRRLVEAGRVVLVDSYHFDDMHGESRHSGQTLPVALMPADRETRKSGTAYLFPHDFTTASGAARKNPNGDITLRVHGNCSYTLRVVEV